MLKLLCEGARTETKNSDKIMERRDAIRYTAVFLGATMSASTVTALLSGCTVDESENWTPVFFNRQQTHFIRELSETILPRTTTPGGKDALVERFIDTIRPLRYTVEENQLFLDELNAFMEKAEVDLGKGFGSVTVDKQLSWVQAIDQKSFEEIKDKTDLAYADRPFYLRLKEQILGGYFSSEKVAKEYFAYDPVPGRYEGCIPYENVGRGWAL